MTVSVNGRRTTQTFADSRQPVNHPMYIRNSAALSGTYLD
jgi:hypothetical protein